jgi:hypothetical protein
MGVRSLLPPRRRRDAAAVRTSGRAALVLLAALAATFGSTAPALAHGGGVGADLQVAASLGERELTVVIRRVGQVPGPLRVDVVNHAGSPGGTLRLGAAATTGQDTTSTGNESDLRLTDGGGFAGTTLRVDQVGTWELRIDDGQETGRIPFVVPADVTATWEWTMSGAYTAAGGLLLAALAAAVFGRRSWPPLALGGGAAGAVVVATTAALLSSSIPPDPPIDPATGRPAITRALQEPSARAHVNLLADADLTVGRRSPIDLRFTDGSTGRPVDDLVVHHNALLHFVVLGPGGQFAHLHPVRQGPGHYRVWFEPTSGGEYRVHAELERRGAGAGAGGIQLVHATLPATGPAVAEATVPGPGDRTLAAGTTARVEAQAVVAGEPSVLTLDVGEAGQPVRDLQPWLGMAGHLITVSPQGTVGHVHAMPSGTAATLADGGSEPDETVATGGPRVEFVYTFATPGRHRLWFQVERDYQVLTIPVELDVAAAPAARSESGS